jgi:lysozyme family protein
MLKPDYKALWDSMVIDPKRDPAIRLAAQHIKNFMTRYQNVGVSVCPLKPIPWYVIGLIHYMEGGQNFNTHLYNGDPLSDRTKHYPPGMPAKGNPPFSWEYSATCALRDQGWGVSKIWDYDDILDRLEDYNGHGYWKRDIYTPYLWSGTNHYTKGKYEEVWNQETKKYDVHFDKDEVSQQLGAAPILYYILNNGTQTNKQA